MKAIVMDRFGGSDVLHMAEVPTPMPAENEVLIHVSHTSVNPVDWKIREGYLSEKIPHEFPIVPGWDAAGSVKAIGRTVTGLHVGDRVYAYCRKPIVQWGTYAEYVAVEASSVSLMPKNLSYAEAAAVPLVALTAWQCLFEAAKLKKGESILVHAGAGGVGSFAIQFAKNAGAKVITTATEKKHGYVKELGADAAIDYSKGDWTATLRQHEPKGVDVVLDLVGGDTLKQSYSVVKPAGRLVSIVETPDSELASKHHVNPYYVFVTPNGSQLKEMAILFEKGALKAPKIEEMSLEEAAAAQERSATRRTQGKIVLKV